MKILFTPSFTRALRTLWKKNPELENVFWKKVEIFHHSPFHTSLKTHNLGGKLKGLRSFSLTKDIRIVFEFMPDGTALFSNIGDHDEVY